MEYSENIIQNIVMRKIYNGFGIQGSFQGQEATASFKIENDLVMAICLAEGSLNYNLPNGHSLSHKSDILIEITEKNQPHTRRYISIEIKHKSAVTDQFKTRSFDMLHLKQSYGSRLYGIMLFVKANTGISIMQARKICYPFDCFIDLDQTEMNRPKAWDELMTAIKGYLV